MNPGGRSTHTPPPRAARRVGPPDGATIWMSALESRFAKAEAKLNTSRRRLLRQVLDNNHDTYFLSSRELAKRFHVDTSTVVRSVQALGYRRYADFVADLRSHFVSSITPYRLMKSAAREQSSVADRIDHSLEMEARNLAALRSSLHPDRIIEIARRIHHSRRILVVGLDFAAPLARLLAYGLVSLGHDADAPEGTTGNLQQKIMVLGPKDLLIGISFGRCLRDTVESVIRAHKRRVSTFGITNSDASPIARLSDSFWVVPSSNSFHDSYVAALAAINALFVACAHIYPQRSLSLLRLKEQEFRFGSRWYSPANREAVGDSSWEDSYGPAGSAK